MKKLFYLLAASTMFLAACESEPSYKITGSAPEMADSTMIYLQKVVGRKLVNLDSAMVIKGAFSFCGRQDTAVHRYVTGKTEDKRYRTDFLLETGQNAMHLADESSVTGTPCNDAYHAFLTDYKTAKKEEQAIYATRPENDEQIAEMMKKLNATHAQMCEASYNHISLNVTNHVGAYLFPEYIDFLSHEQQKELLAKMPEEFKNNRQIAKIIQRVEILDKTAVGQPFTDFEMPDSNGKMAKVSDFVNKNKYTLVDFWASWCGPCRAEMPHVIEAYKKYSKQGFGIVGVSLDDDEAMWKKSIKDWGMTWPHISDLKSFECAGAALYGINSIPSTVLIAQDGTIVARNLRGKALEEKLEELFK